ncbi:MAG: phosphatase PAP2 family protein [Deltaproteobacteria bacterium]|nr:phosphatase PAP2 family protein [Deltaproteobacteria bacterium]
MDTRAAAALQTGIDRLIRWDASVLVSVRRWEHRWIRRLMKALTRAGDTPGWIVHGLVLAALLESGSHVVALLAAGAGAGTITCQLLKRVCRRARPDAAIAGFAATLENPDVFSFPSGHSTVAFAVGTAIATADPVLGALELTLASAIACSRVVLGAHYPLDVAAGIVLGIGSGLAASWFF